jgi:hypothetical protein
LIVVGGTRFKKPGVTTPVRSGSPLDELRKVGRHLSERSVSWKDDYATRFVLTGEPPEETPLRTEKGPGGKIAIHVAAAWDAEYPEWAYRGDTRTMWLDYNRTLRQVAPETARKGRR